MNITEKDKRALQEMKRISKKGNNAEVKWQDKNGDWVIYEVQKKKKTVG